MKSSDDEELKRKKAGYCVYFRNSDISCQITWLEYHPSMSVVVVQALC